MDKLRKSGDSVGAEITAVAHDVPVGWGEPVYDKLDADIAYAMMGINAVKGVEIGAGFASVAQKGTEHGDEMTPQGFLSNNAGGILGGISTGQDIVVQHRRQADVEHPVAAPFHRQERRADDRRDHGRHDPCVGIRATPIAEAMLALVLMDHALRHRAQNADVRTTTPGIAAQAPADASEQHQRRSRAPAADPDPAGRSVSGAHRRVLAGSIAVGSQRAPWKPVSAPASVASSLFMRGGQSGIWPTRASAGCSILDTANLAFHEAGHPLFGSAARQPAHRLRRHARSTGVSGRGDGRPSGGAAKRCRLRCARPGCSRTSGTSPRYMADARAQVLPLVGNGEHDWTEIFSALARAASGHQHRRLRRHARLDRDLSCLGLARVALVAGPRVPMTPDGRRDHESRLNSIAPVQLLFPYFASSGAFAPYFAPVSQVAGLLACADRCAACSRIRWRGSFSRTSGAWLSDHDRAAAG